MLVETNLPPGVGALTDAGTAAGQLAQTAREEIERLEAENAELRAALKPFGRFHEARREMGGYFPTGPVYALVSSVAGEASLNAEDFAKAHELSKES